MKKLEQSIKFRFPVIKVAFDNSFLPKAVIKIHSWKRFGNYVTINWSPKQRFIKFIESTMRTMTAKKIRDTKQRECIVVEIKNTNYISSCYEDQTKRTMHLPMRFFDRARNIIAGYYQKPLSQRLYNCLTSVGVNARDVFARGKVSDSSAIPSTGNNDAAKSVVGAPEILINTTIGFNK